MKGWVSRTVDIGGAPRGVGVVDRLRRALVVCGDAGVITFDTAARTIINHVALSERWARAIVCCTTTGRTFVCDCWSGQVHILDTASGTPLAVTAFDHPVRGVSVLHSRRRILVAAADERGQDALYILDAVDGHLVGRVALGRGPWTFGVDEQRGTVYIGHLFSPFIRIIDVEQCALVTDIPVAGYSGTSVVVPQWDRTYAVDGQGVLVIDAASQRVVWRKEWTDLCTPIGAPLEKTFNPAVAIDPTVGRVFVAAMARPTHAAVLLTLDAHTGRPLKWRKAGYTPLSLLVDDARHILYVLDTNTEPTGQERMRGDANVQVLDTRTRFKRASVHIGWARARLTAGAICKASGTLLVLSALEGTVTVLERSPSEVIAGPPETIRVEGRLGISV